MEAASKKQIIALLLLEVLQEKYCIPLLFLHEHYRIPIDYSFLQQDIVITWHRGAIQALNDSFVQYMKEQYWQKADYIRKAQLAYYP